MVRQHNVAILDLLRLGAALWVVISHVCIITNRFLPWLSEGWIAVEVFIFISGFLMCYILKGERTKGKYDVINFWIRRFFRIAPLFFLSVFVYVAFRSFYLKNILEGEHFFKSSSIFSSFIVPISTLDVFKNLTFIHGLFPREGSKIFGPAWSLSLEIQFYLIAPFLLNWYNKHPGKVILFIFLINAVAITCIGFHEHKGLLVDYRFPSFLPCKILLFLLGMICCKACLKDDKKEYFRLLLVTMLCFLIYSFKGMIPVFLSIIAVYYMINFRNSFVDRVNRLCSLSFIRSLANYSYGVYLIHQFMFAVIFFLFLRFLGSFSQRNSIALFFILVVTASVLISGILYYVYEMPLRKRGIKLSNLKSGLKW